MYTYGLDKKVYKSLQSCLRDSIIVYGINGDEKVYIHILPHIIDDLKYKLEQWWNKMREERYYYDNFFITGEIEVDYYTNEIGYDKESWYNHRESQYLGILEEGYFPDRIFFGGIRLTYDKNPHTNPVYKNTCIIGHEKSHGGHDFSLQRYLKCDEGIIINGQMEEIVYTVNRDEIKQLITNLEKDEPEIIKGLYRRELTNDDYIHLEKCECGYGYCAHHSIHRDVKLNQNVF